MKEKEIREEIAIAIDALKDDQEAIRLIWDYALTLRKKRNPAEQGAWAGK